MRKLDRYVQVPGVCFVCRSAQREGEAWVLDLDVDVVDGIYAVGRVYLCQQCSMEVGSEAGMAPPFLRDQWIAERDAAVLQCRELTDEVTALREALALLTAIKPAPVVELKATPKYACAVCLADGVSPKDADKQNPQGLARHAQAKHGLKYNAVVLKGDAALQETPA